MAPDPSARPPILTPGDVVTAIDGGAIPIDLREPAAFGAIHLPGSINVPFSPRRLPERVANAVRADATILLVGDDEIRLLAASWAIAASPLSSLGYLDHGLSAWIGAGYPTQRLAGISVHDLQAHHAVPGGSVAVVDVREPIEWEELGHIEGAILLPLGQIARRYRELPQIRPLAVVCEQGIRSSTAASILLRHGFTNLANVLEGMAGWRLAGYPVIDWVHAVS